MPLLGHRSPPAESEYEFKKISTFSVEKFVDKRGTA